jgi:hypothetical protein
MKEALKKIAAERSVVMSELVREGIAKVVTEHNAKLAASVERAVKRGGDRTAKRVQIAADKAVKEAMAKRDPGQAWFWTEEWQEKEREADEDIARGDYETFDDMDDFIRSLDE